MAITADLKLATCQPGAWPLACQEAESDSMGSGSLTGHCGPYRREPPEMRPS